MATITVCDRCGQPCYEGPLAIHLEDPAVCRDLLATLRAGDQAGQVRITVKCDERTDGFEARDLCRRCWGKLLEFLVRTEAVNQ